MNELSVSIIIPAYNATATLAETIASLSAQTFPHWEAIIVDNNSQDETLTIAKNLAKQDSRIRIAIETQQGLSATRNHGIKLAKFDWLLFLDADDWIAPEYLEKMTQAIASDRDVDGVHCGWVRVAPDGQLAPAKHGPQLPDLFEILSRYCPFAIHACVIRKAKVEAVGGFDISVYNCQDWDLWQRIARCGAKFASIPDVMAFYRMRPGSLSSDGVRFFSDALRVLMQGYTSDLRVSNPLPAYANGIITNDLQARKLYVSSWLSGLVIGRGKDACHLLKLLENDSDPRLEPYIIATSLFESVIIPTCKIPRDWYQIFSDVEHGINDFLLALEKQSGTFALACRTWKILERLILQNTENQTEITIGNTHAIKIEITAPIADIKPPTQTERLHCWITMAGTHLGSIELPIIDGIVTSWVIKDAIANQLAWPILGKFFAHTVYPANDETAHDRIGWTTFLQQIWGRYDWQNQDFYNPDLPETEIKTASLSDNLITIELTSEIPNFTVNHPEIKVIFNVGGVTLGIFTIPIQNNFISAQALRVALTWGSGFELCRFCVREGILGKPIPNKNSLGNNSGESLRDRLAASQYKLEITSQFPSPTAILGYRYSQELSPAIGTSANRRAVLPIATAPEIIEMAKVCRETLVLPPGDETAQHLIYAPEIISLDASPRPWRSKNTSSPIKQIINNYGREHFETLFATNPDPWKYTNPYEQTKYEQTLSLIPKTTIKTALEIACAEGHFTIQLAPKVNQLVVTDISQIALERTADRCQSQGIKNVSFQQFDLTTDPIPGQFQLITCSEMLYYVGSVENLKTVAAKIADALLPGGYLITAHAHQIIDEPDQPGFDWGLSFGAKVIGETFASIPSLYLVKEIRTPLYRVQLFQREPKWIWPWTKRPPEIITFDQQPAPLPPEVEAQVKWNGGQAWQGEAIEPVFTHKLPILMYHRVAPTGSAAMSSYRVTPAAFEEQLRYLRDAGFYSITSADWLSATLAKRPLPGKAIWLTFDDAYLDVYEYAWPLLKSYGFTATIFVVADHIGSSNSWDKAYGEELPLMGWEHLRQLRDEGVEFGSHSASHLPLTALSAAEVVQEAARSRTILEQGLDVAIKTFAYPFGDFDQSVQHLIGACGYTMGLSCRWGASSLNDDLLALSRIEIMGNDTLQEFVKKLTY